jgi:hypothetical protein
MFGIGKLTTAVRTLTDNVLALAARVRDVNTGATALFWADLANPLALEEYAGLVLQEVVLREPPSAETRAYYRAKGWGLGCFLRKGMTELEVHRVVGVRPGGGVRVGDRQTDTYRLLGLQVHYRLAEVDMAETKELELVGERVEATPPRPTSR